jgi:hypothetical protein
MLIDVPCCTVVSGSPEGDIRGSVEQLQTNVESVQEPTLGTKGKKKSPSRFSPGAVIEDISKRYLTSLIDDGSFKPPQSWSVEVTRNYLRII